MSLHQNELKKIRFFFLEGLLISRNRYIFIYRYISEQRQVIMRLVSVK